MSGKSKNKSYDNIAGTVSVRVSASLYAELVAAAKDDDRSIRSAMDMAIREWLERQRKAD
jgi:hypothetical protein